MVKIVIIKLLNQIIGADCMDSPHTLKFTHMKKDQNGRGNLVCPRVTCALWFGRLVGSVHRCPHPALIPAFPQASLEHSGRVGLVLPAPAFSPIAFH